MFAGHKTPAATLKRISNEARWTTQQADIRERFTAVSVQPASSAPEEFTAHVRAEIEKWGRVVRERGIKIN